MQDLLQIRRILRENIPGAVPEQWVLCTLVRKQGSSYRGLGAKKLVSRSGRSYGMLSGGCLEASIEKMACERAGEKAFLASFSTLSEEDRLFGYQTGCQGVIEVLFETLPENANLDLYLPFGSNVQAPGVSVSLHPESLGERTFTHDSGSDDFVFFEKWQEPVQLFVLGCGADADPFESFAETLGWELHFIDYRRHLAYPHRFLKTEAQYCPLEKIGTLIPQGPKVAVVLMTHNYEADLELVAQLRHHELGYLGALGPARRWERMQSDLLRIHDTVLSRSFLDKVRAPAGIFEKSSSPAEIALAITAQVQGLLVESVVPKPWTLVLAAGASSRYGGVKALAQFQGETLIASAHKKAHEVSGKNVVVVTGGHKVEIEQELSTVDAQAVHNPYWELGMGTSIACGVNSILEKDPQAQSIIILPMDQPLVTAAHLENLCQESERTGLCALTVNAEGLVGSPAVVPRKFFECAQNLQGDRGLKSVLSSEDFSLVYHPEALQDIDHPRDLEFIHSEKGF